MANKFFNIFLTIIFFYMSYSIIILKILPYKNGDIKLTNYYIIYSLGIIFLLFGLYFLYLFFTYKQVKHKYTICPNCKETFDYKDLDNGKCKYCDDIDTIDIEQYYKDNPRQENE